MSPVNYGYGDGINVRGRGWDIPAFARSGQRFCGYGAENPIEFNQGYQENVAGGPVRRNFGENHNLARKNSYRGTGNHFNNAYGEL